MTDEPKQQFGPYIVERLLGIGASSRVWLANGPTGKVALKVLRDEKRHGAFENEINILKTVQNPGLVQLVFADPDAKWFAMEYIPGPNLHEWCLKVDISRIVAAFSSLLETLHSLHQAGFCHGDIKSSNIRMDANERPKLIDLGIARKPTRSISGFSGTLGYAAPEVLKGQSLQLVSDLYGFGVVFYQGLTGQLPFITEDPAALAYLPLVSLPLPPSSYNPAVPRKLDQLILKLLCRDPKHRPVSAKDAGAQLRNIALVRTHPPVIGMEKERRRLGRAVMAAADGESSVIVLYGPPGSGRKTLIKEALGHAQRQGLTPTKSSKLDLVRKGTHTPTSPPVLALSGSHPDLLPLTQDLCSAQVPSLILVHSVRPLPRLQPHAEHITPPPLTPKQVEQLGTHYFPEQIAPLSLWERTRGHPSSVMALINSANTLAPAGPSTPDDTRIITILKRQGNMGIQELAAELTVNEHDLLDLLQPLLSAGILRTHNQRVGLTEGIQL